MISSPFKVCKNLTKKKYGNAMFSFLANIVLFDFMASISANLSKLRCNIFAQFVSLGVIGDAAF